MLKVTMQEYLQASTRYELQPGRAEGAPPCPFGNQFEWVGYDKETATYVRFTKAVFKLLVRQA